MDHLGDPVAEVVWVKPYPEPVLGGGGAGADPAAPAMPEAGRRYSALYICLDLTPLGRREDWEQPACRSSGPSLSWLCRHDEYDT